MAVPAVARLIMGRQEQPAHPLKAAVTDWAKPINVTIFANAGRTIVMRQEYPLGAMTMKAWTDWIRPFTAFSGVVPNRISTVQQYPLAAIPLTFGWMRPQNPNVVNYDSRIFALQEYPRAALAPKAMTEIGVVGAAPSEELPHFPIIFR